MEKNNEQKMGTQTAQNQAANTGANFSDGNLPESMGRVERAEQAIKRMEELERSIGEKVTQLDHLRSELILGGGSYAGTSEQKKKDESPAEYAKRVIRGQL